ncbi:MAG: hypothetical protein HQK57_13880 [Deltaproteobacteria bacterium]|nr:hypothetical protein [Deltaproteobacteria bacterium]
MALTAYDDTAMTLPDISNQPGSASQIYLGDPGEFGSPQNPPYQAHTVNLVNSARRLYQEGAMPAYQQSKQDLLDRLSRSGVTSAGQLAESMGKLYSGYAGGLSKALGTAQIQQEGMNQSAQERADSLNQQAKQFAASNGLSTLEAEARLNLARDQAAQQNRLDTARYNLAAQQANAQQRLNSARFDLDSQQAAKLNELRDAQFKQDVTNYQNTRTDQNLRNLMTLLNAYRTEPNYPDSSGSSGNIINPDFSARLSYLKGLLGL